MGKKKEMRADARSGGCGYKSGKRDLSTPILKRDARSCSLTVTTKKGAASTLTLRPRSSYPRSGKTAVTAAAPQARAPHPFAGILGKYGGPEWEDLQAEVQRQRESVSE